MMTKVGEIEQGNGFGDKALKNKNDK